MRTNPAFSRALTPLSSPREGSQQASPAPPQAPPLPVGTELRPASAVDKAEMRALLRTIIQEECLAPLSTQLETRLQSHQQTLLHEMDCYHPKARIVRQSEEEKKLDALRQDVASMMEQLQELGKAVSSIPSSIPSFIPRGSRASRQTSEHPSARGAPPMDSDEARNKEQQREKEEQAAKSQDVASPRAAKVQDLERQQAANLKKSLTTPVVRNPVSTWMLGAMRRYGPGLITKAMGTLLPEETCEEHQPEPDLTQGQKVLQVVSMVLVAAHCLYMGFNVQTKMANALNGREPSTALYYADCCFAIVFAIELSVRIKLFGRQFYRGEDRNWNFFDLALVAMSVFELMVDSLNFAFMRSLRAIRAVRAARIIRAVRFVRQLRIMVATLLCCLPALFWAAVLLFFIIYLFSVLIMQLLSGETCGIPQDDAVRIYFDNVQHSMMSLFMGFSGGLDWELLVKPLRRVSEWYNIIFIMYILVVTFGIMNILTAIFVQGSRVETVDQDIAIQDKILNDLETMNSLRGVLRRASSKYNMGLITMTEMEEELRNPDTLALLEILGLGVTETRGLFRLLDLDSSEMVSIEEIVRGMMRLRGHVGGLDMATLMLENKRMMTKLTALTEYMGMDRSAMVLDVLPADEQQRMIKTRTCPPSRTLDGVEI